MKNILTLSLLIVSFSLHAQVDFMQVMFDINDQPQRVKGYSKTVSLSYGLIYDEEASIDTTIINADGSITELTLNKKTVTIFGDKEDVAYDISVGDNDTTMITTSTYNDKGLVLTQNQNLGDDDVAAMFNSDKTFTYDDKGRMLSMINTAGEESSGATFSYNDDGLPQSLNMNTGMGTMKVTRKEMDGYIKFEVGGEMSEEMKEMMAMMGKSIDDMPQEFYELRKKKDLFEIKHMKEEGDEKVLTLQSITTRDIDGNLHEEIKYMSDEIITHKKNTYVEGKLSNIADLLEDSNYVIEYDKNGNPLNAIDGFSKSTMTYNAEGMMISKISSSTFSDGTSGLEVVKYYK